jgi:hypothetical protein
LKEQEKTNPDGTDLCNFTTQDKKIRKISEYNHLNIPDEVHRISRIIKKSYLADFLQLHYSFSLRIFPDHIFHYF